MADYQPLFSIEADHTYFEGQACRGLQLRPTPASAALLANTGCLLRPLRHGVAVAYDRDAADAVRLQIRDPHAPLCLDFLGGMQDARFSLYTDLPSPADTLLMFHSDAAQREDDGGRWRLHAQAHVSAADVVPLDAPPASELLTRRERLVPPRLAVRVRVSEEDLDLAEPGGKRYLLRFQARATVWKYYVVGDWAQDEIHIVDLQHETGFDAAVPEPLPDGRTALAVRSLTRIALHERPAHRFQLRGRSGNTERVLVKRLPVAGSSPWSVETIRGEPTPVSEIYVHR
ncbi:MAG TPA: hypothetical protein VFL86_21910 [Burkholderiaceae bacterium]|nr:hypothetical protein [Burkholderiaceae bacterium]